MFLFFQERAEWINSILKQLWPNVGHYTRKVIAESVEPAVKAALDNYGLTGFKFEKVVLGQIPPRVTGIKVYDKNVGRNEIILDLVRYQAWLVFLGVNIFNVKVSKKGTFAVNQTYLRLYNSFTQPNI